MEPEGSFLHDQHENSSSSEQEENHQPSLPMANVVRIMRKVLPPRTMITDQAKEAIVACASEYIGFITMEANELCQKQNRLTITAEDLLSAMAKLGFDNYVNNLTLYLDRYRENVAAGSRGQPQLPPPRPRTSVPPPQLSQPPPPPAAFESIEQMGESSSSSGNVITQFDPFTYLNRDRFLDD